MLASVLPVLPLSPNMRRSTALFFGDRSDPDFAVEFSSNPKQGSRYQIPIEYDHPYPLKRNAKHAKRWFKTPSTAMRETWSNWQTGEAEEALHIAPPDKKTNSKFVVFKRCHLECLIGQAYLTNIVLCHMAHHLLKFQEKNIYFDDWFLKQMVPVRTTLSDKELITNAVKETTTMWKTHKNLWHNVTTARKKYDGHILEFEKIFHFFNVSDDHWQAFVVFPQTKTIEAFCPLGRKVSPIAHHALLYWVGYTARLQDENTDFQASEWKLLVQRKTPIRQANMYDCYTALSWPFLSWNGGLNKK